MLWFRMYNEFAKDPKVQSMDEAMQRRLVMLFCLQGSGELAQLSDEELAYALRITSEELVRTLEGFRAKGFIDSKRRVRNWDKRQFKSDLSTERVKRFRNVPETPRKRPQIQIQIQSTDSEKPTEGSAEPANADSAPPAAICLPTNNGKEFPVAQAKVSEWEVTYPAVDVPQTLKEIRQWLVDNPSRRKTAKGMHAFVNRWLTKEQNGGKYG